MHFVCADDAHGAAIMIAAEKAGKTPQAFVAEIAAGRKPIPRRLPHRVRQLALDRRRREPRARAGTSTSTLRKEGLIAVKTIEQFFDPVKAMFLPDRYIKGECPVCGAKDQYGDACENCGSVYAPTDLKNPVLDAERRDAGAALERALLLPALRSQRCVDFLKGWTHDAGRLQPEVLNKISEWFKVDEHGHGGLADWDISRDAPYFGIEIPDAPGKYFYVWLDAPVGYLASLKNYFDNGRAKASGERVFDEFMADPDARADALHRQGHHLLPHAVLAGDAALQRPQGARPRLRARLHHRRAARR